MKNAGNNSARVFAQRKRMRVRTTFLELLSGLMDRTPDDASLMASLRHLFDISDVRVVRSLAPVRLTLKEPATYSRAGARPRTVNPFCA
jgi:hypothetical protein